MTDQVVTNVVNKYQGRSAVGIRKYGTTLEENNTDNFFQHLQEELMDATLYVQKLMEQREQLIKLIRETENDQELGVKIRHLIR